MSNLSKRVEKADKLIFTDIPSGKETIAATWGSNNDHYTISLSQKKEQETVQIADKSINAVVISTHCQRLDIGNGKLNPMEPCQGNDRHTICYHSMGYIKSKLAERGKQISFYEDIFDALNGLNFGGQLTKIISKQGNGNMWAIIRKRYIMELPNTVTLMRGDEKEQEGID